MHMPVAQRSTLRLATPRNVSEPGLRFQRALKPGAMPFRLFGYLVIL